MPARKPDRIAAIATAPGRGGIGVVRVSGADLLPLAEALAGCRPSPRYATLADFRDAQGQGIDSGLLLYFPAPHSFTGDDVLELQGHGGPVVLQMLLARCLELGARLAEPGEFTRRAYENGKLDLAQAEAVADLIDATTASAARSAVRSLQGAFSNEIHALVDQLTELRALTEATLDFPDEEIDFLKSADAFGRLSRIGERLANVFDRAAQGCLLQGACRWCWSASPTSANPVCSINWPEMNWRLLPRWRERRGMRCVAAYRLKAFHCISLIRQACAIPMTKSKKSALHEAGVRSSGRMCYSCSPMHSMALAMPSGQSWRTCRLESSGLPSRTRSTLPDAARNARKLLMGSPSRCRQKPDRD